MRILGHPLHPMLVHFPIAGWSIASACDLAVLAGWADAWRIGWVALVVGLGGALPSAAAGMLDLGKLPEAAVPTGMRHMLLMGSALLAYGAALALRSMHAPPAPLPIACSLAGFALLAAGGHFGAALVYRFGAGREEKP